MKLVDGMKDEKLGSALLYCFTKGYGAVPMDLYNLVLPLLFVCKLDKTLPLYLYSILNTLYSNDVPSFLFV